MPTFRSKITSKGQITIPLEIRKRLGLAREIRWNSIPPDPRL